MNILRGSGLSGLKGIEAIRDEKIIRPLIETSREEIEEYLEKRDEMKRVFMLVDFRIKPTENDILMYKFLKYYNIPVTLILNKADKVGTSKHNKNLEVIKNALK